VLKTILNWRIKTDYIVVGNICNRLHRLKASISCNKAMNKTFFYFSLLVSKQKEENIVFCCRLLDAGYWMPVIRCRLLDINY